MIDVPDEVRAALDDPSAIATETAGQAIYQGRAVDLNIAPDGDLTWDADGGVQCSGGITVFGFGDDLVPTSRDSMLAPYGQEVTLYRRILVSGAEYAIPLGVYRITGNDGGRRTRRVGRTLDWEVGVSLADRFRMLERGKIVAPEASPPPGATMYTELQRLALFPMLVTMDDVDAPASLAYDERLNAVHDLAALAGAKPRINRQGALLLRPADRWLTETVPDFDISGTIDWSDEQSDEFYNYVWAHSDDGVWSSIRQLADDSDPRSVNRAGPSTYEHSSPAYVSQDAVDQGAETILARLLNRRSKLVTVEVGPVGLLVELSDFGWVRDPDNDRAVLGEVSGVSIPNDPIKPIQLTLIVAEEA